MMTILQNAFGSSGSLSEVLWNDSFFQEWFKFIADPKAIEYGHRQIVYQ
jgi:hypothetical protein